MSRGTLQTPLPIDPGGIREDVGIDAIPDGYLLSASNVLTRNGLGRPRPGSVQVGSTLAAGDAVIGIGFRGSPETAARLVVHTLTKAYSYNGTTFSDKTGTWTTSTALQPVRFTTLQAGASTVYIARINGANAVDVWDGGAGNFVDASGTPPNGIDMTTSSGRVVVVGADGDGNQVRVGDFNSVTFAAASAANQFFLTDTSGSFVACRAFGPNTVGLYKDDAAYVGVAQAAAAPFQFQFIGRTTGPVGPSALVNAFGTHYWLAKNGLIYKFDGGSNLLPIGQGLNRTALQHFSYDNRMATHGCVLQTAQPEIWWWYPDSDTGTTLRAVCLNLVTDAITNHIWTTVISASASWISQGSLTYATLPGTFATLPSAYPTYDSLTSAAQPTAILGESTGVVAQFGVAINDRGTAIPWEFIHGWREPNKGARMYVDGVRSLWRKTTTSLTVTVGLTASTSLSDDSTTDAEQTSTFDMSTGSDHVVTFPNTVGRFFKVRVGAASQVEAMEHRRSDLLGWPRGAV